jgi:hypothetical protein
MPDLTEFHERQRGSEDYPMFRKAVAIERLLPPPQIGSRVDLQRIGQTTVVATMLVQQAGVDPPAFTQRIYVERAGLQRGD